MKTCRRCRAEIRNWRSVLDNLCGLCLAIARDELDAYRVQFEALLSAGWTTEAANAEIIRRQDEHRRWRDAS